MIVEPSVQAAAGMQLADHAGLARLGAACRAHDVLLICDEIATGFGRTGTLFASEQCDLRPDLLCLGKGLTAGYLPMSVTAASGPCLRGVPRRRPRRAHALPRPFVRRERARGRGRVAPPRADRRVGRAGQRARAFRRARRPPARPDRGEAGGARGAPARAHGRGRARAPERRRRSGAGASSAAAVDRGVLLRSIGDNVTLMPPLTITSEELHRVVHALSEAIDEVGGTDGGRRDLGRLGRRRGQRDPRRGPLARAAHARCQGPRRHAHRRRPRRRVVRVERLPRPHRASRRDRGRARSPRPLGRGRRIGPAHRRRAAGPRRARTTSSHEWKSMPSARRCSRPVSPPTSASSPRSPARACWCAATSSTTRRSSTVAGSLAPTSPCTGTAISTTSRPCCTRPRRAPCRSSSATPCSRWTATSPIVDALVELCAREGALLVVDEAHAVLGPDLDVAADADVLRIGTLSKTLGSLGGFVAGFGTRPSSSSRTWPGPTSSRPHRRPPTPRPRSRRSGSSGRPRARRSSHACAHTSNRLRPGHPSPIVPFVCGEEQRALDAARPRSSTRACSCPPSARRRFPPVRRACASTVSAAHTDAQIDRAPCARARPAALGERSPVTHDAR